MSEAKRTPTPTPWDYVPSTEHHGPYVTSEFGSTICDLYVMSNPSEPSVRNGGRSRPIHHLHEMADPNAALIVKAVNAHADAIVLAKRVIEYFGDEPVSAMLDCDVALRDMAKAFLAKADAATPAAEAKE